MPAARGCRPVTPGCRLAAHGCRLGCPWWQVKKPKGAKAGLVQLSGDVRTIAVDWRRERWAASFVSAWHNTKGAHNVPKAVRTVSRPRLERHTHDDVK